MDVNILFIENMKIISMINHKGGVGKTTSALNVGIGLGINGKKVLLIDSDPQANLTQALGINETETSIYDSFSKGIALPIINIKHNIDLVPSSLDFAGIELEMASRMAREKVLTELLEPLKDQYDLCIIDAPPSLGLITMNVMVASNYILIPIIAEYLPFKGIDSIVGIISQVRKHYKPDLKILGTFFTQHKGNRVITRDIEKELCKYFGDGVFQSKIRVNVALPESQINGVDVFEYDANSNAAKDYLALIKEIEKKLNI